MTKIKDAYYNKIKLWPRNRQWYTKKVMLEIALYCDAIEDISVEFSISSGFLEDFKCSFEIKDKK